MSKTLVAIADYGGRNTTAHVKKCFENEAFEVLTFSTVEGDFIFKPSVGENLPFLHRLLFAREVEKYDFFFYTENDIIYPEIALLGLYNNFDTFGKNRPLGLIRTEGRQLIDFAAVVSGPKIDYKESNGFSAVNAHQGSYLLSRHQLHVAIDSGRYLIEPSARGGYGKLETGASNVYFECGLSKMYPLQNLEALLVHHMEWKWVYLQPRYTLDNLHKELEN